MNKPKTAGELEALIDQEDYPLEDDPEWERLRQELQDIAREHEPRDSDKQKIGL